ncbi:MAG: hypothetical protein QNJ88_16265 [Acidimicrobiia bacterium]|nr:hypothetical protein [Acidimicrobiia bacterium]
MTSPITLAAHLVRRFFGHLRATPLSPGEQDLVADALSPELAQLFHRQSPPDQRHAFDVARRVRSALPTDDAAFSAALLHDVGKAVAAIGPIARSLATVFDALRIPMPAHWRSYRNHGAIGADALTAAGAPTLAVVFARHHPGPAPEGIDPDVWNALVAADNV